MKVVQKVKTVCA